MAMGDPQVRPGTTEHSISREFSQSGYIDGLPLGTVGGAVVRHVFPADAEYKLSGRLVRGVQDGYAGVEGNDTPYTFVITVDGTEVYSAPVGGPARIQRCRAPIWLRGPAHYRQEDDGTRCASPMPALTMSRFTSEKRRRPAQLQDVWEPSKRTTARKSTWLRVCRS